MRKHYDLEVGTQEMIDAGLSPFYQKVAEVFNEAVTNSQSMADISHRPRVMYGQGDLAKALTMFKSDSAQSYNMLRRLAGEVARAKTDGNEAAVKDAKKKLASGICAALAGAVGGEAIAFLVALLKNKAKWYRDDDDELTVGSVASEIGSGILSHVAGMTLAGEELMEALLSWLDEDESWWNNNLLESMTMKQLNDVLGVLKDVAQGTAGLIGDLWNIGTNGGDVGEYLSEHYGDILGGIKTAAEKAAMYLGGVPAENVEKYLLGTVRWLTPEIAAAYDSVTATTTKKTLGLAEGKELRAKIENLFTVRDVEVSDETAEEIARLYEAGYKTAVPPVTTKFTVDGVEHEMGAYEQQTFENSFAEYMGDELEELMGLGEYIEAGDEVRAKMVAKIYDYAGQLAKTDVDGNYGADEWTGEAMAYAEAGGTVAAYVAAQVLKKAEEDYDMELSLVREAVDSGTSNSQKLEAIYAVVGAERAERLRSSTRYGVTADVYAEFRETLEDFYDYDPEGSAKSLNGTEVEAAVRSMSGLNNEQQAALYQLGVDTTNKGGKNPFSAQIGTAMYEEYMEWKGGEEEDEYVYELPLPGL